MSDCLSVSLSAESDQTGVSWPESFVYSEKSRLKFAAPHSQPTSTAQVASQPSPSVVLPSSQPSVEAMILSPQVAARAWAGDRAPMSAAKAARCLEVRIVMALGLQIRGATQCSERRAPW